MSQSQNHGQCAETSSLSNCSESVYCPPKKMVGEFTKKSVLIATVVGIISLLYATAGFLSNDTPIAYTENGQVQGKVQYSRNGSMFLAFLGIPFAEPPVGELRFEAPQPLKEAWTGVKQVTSYSAHCLQFDAMVFGRMVGKEDCLYLNVFTNGTEGKRPVMIYLHGGGFMSGASKMYQPHFFMDHVHEIVLVTINYRLGPLGFMNTGDGLISGNMGLKDQLMAMKWVQRNIDKFGGDRDKITIFGESAGAASVEYHMISPRSKGIFHRAILQSGAATCPWSFMSNPRQVSMKYIEKMNCPFENSTETLNCLKAMDPTKIVKLQSNLMHPVNDFLMFVPSAELESREDAFLTENPRKLLKQGKIANKVPAIFGVVSGEGALRTARLDAVPESIQQIDDNWASLAPKILSYDNHDGRHDQLTGDIRNLYFGTNKFNDDLHSFQKNYSKMCSDALFFEPIRRTAKIHAEQGEPTFLYFYDYNAVLLPNMYSLFRAVRDDDWLFSEIKIAFAAIVDIAKKSIFGLKGPHEFGETHANDLLQLWNLEGLTALLAGPDSDFSKKFVKSFVDFARNEKPLEFSNIPWPPIPHLTKVKTQGSATSSSQLPYMLLGTESKVINEPFADRISFWESLRLRVEDSEKK